MILLALLSLLPLESVYWCFLLCHQSCFFVALTSYVGSEASVFDWLSLGYMSWLSVSQLSVTVTNTWDKLTYKEGKFIFDSQFQRFQSMVTWHSCLWACSKRAHYGGEHVAELGSKKRDKRNQVPIFPSKDCFQWLTSTRSYLLKIPPSPNNATDWQPNL